MIDKMGSARKLCTEKREVKLHATPSVNTETVITSRGKKGIILGPYLAFRHPLRCFNYNKSRRRAPGYRASQGHRNHYTWNWRRYLLKNREMPLALFSIKGAKASEMLAMGKEKTEMIKVRAFEPKEQRNIPAKEEKRIDSKAEIEKKKALPAMDSRVEKPATAKTAEKPDFHAPKINVKTDIKVEGIRTVKVVDDGNKYMPVQTVVKVAEIQKKNGPVQAPVSKSEQEGMKTDGVFKTVATTKSPRTSTSKVHDDGRRNDGRPPDTSNFIFARVVAPPFSLLSSSIKLLKFKPEGIIRTVKIKVPETVVKKTGPKPAEREKDDPYHALNRAHHRLVFPKIASGAADSLN